MLFFQLTCGGFLNAVMLLSGSGSNENNDSSWSFSLQMLGQFFFLVVVLIGVAVLAYYGTRLLSRTRMARGKSSNIKVVESASIGFNNSVCIIKTGDKYVLIGITKDKITYLTDLNADSLNFETDEFKRVSILDNYFNKYLGRKTNGKNDNEDKGES